jgi:hypothetical protein
VGRSRGAVFARTRSSKALCAKNTKFVNSRTRSHGAKRHANY